MLERILSYIEEQGRVISATLHYYNEPCALEDINLLVRRCHDHGVYCYMSTNGSFPDRLDRVLEEGLTNLIFSVSGWNEETHQRSHKNVYMENLLRSMEIASRHIHAHKDFRGHPMFVRVSWHDYEYNRSERDLMREHAHKLGFTFTSYQTGVLPLERAMKRMAETLRDPNSPEDVAERDVVTKLKEAQQLCLERKHWQCINQQRMITVDGDGYLHNCCVKAHEANRRKLLFETDLEEFNAYRLTKDADCIACRAMGHHVYAMQQYRLPLGWRTELRKAGENLWRRFNLGGVFPRLSALRGQMVYDRPRRKNL